MDLNCTTDHYATIYKPWLDRPLGEAFRSEIREDDRVLDLCGGTGVVAQLAAKMNCPSVDLVDLNPRVPNGMQRRKIQCWSERAENIDQVFDPHSFDLIVCRQAIGYVNIKQVAWAAAQVLAPGGRFLFNNFRSPKRRIKAYKYDGDRYLEGSWHLGRSVWHLQWRLGYGRDITKFRWHQFDDIVDAFKPFFTFDTVKYGDNSITWRCIVRD